MEFTGADNVRQPLPQMMGDPDDVIVAGGIGFTITRTGAVVHLHPLASVMVTV